MTEGEALIEAIKCFVDTEERKNVMLKPYPTGKDLMEAIKLYKLEDREIADDGLTLEFPISERPCGYDKMEYTDHLLSYSPRKGRFELKVNVWEG